MKNLLAVILVSLTLSACSTFSPTVPENYKGPLASIKDSVKKHSNSKADFFYLDKIDGKDIENSRIKTLDVNYGRGMYMEPHILEHNIPAKASTYKIVGRTEYAAPVLALSNAVYQVSGDIKFTPQPGEKYIVVGILGPQYSAVWVEEQESKRLISNKVEIHGSAALGFFRK